MRFAITLICACATVRGQVARVTVGAPVFGGAGLNDATSGGSYTGPAANHEYTATVCAAGTPDTVSFSRDGGSATRCAAISGGAQAMAWPAGTVTGAGWAAGRATFTDVGHGLVTGELVTVTGATPGGWNVSGATVAVADASHFSVALVSNPGTWTSGGTAVGSDGVTIAWAAMTGHTPGAAWTVGSSPQGSLTGSVVQRGRGAVVRQASDKASDIVSVLDYASCTGSSDDSSGLLNAIAALKRLPRSGTSPGGALYFPANAYCTAYNTSVLVQGFDGVEIYGAGMRSYLKLVNSDLHLNGITFGKVHDLKILAQGTVQAGTLTLVNGSTAVAGAGTAFTPGIVNKFISTMGQGYQVARYTDATHITLARPYSSATTSAATWSVPIDHALRITSSGTLGTATSHGMMLDHVWIECEPAGCQDGLLVDADGGGGSTHPDNNNDFHFANHLIVEGFTHAGAWFKGSQAYSEMLVDPDINSRGYGQYGIMATDWHGTVATEGVGLSGYGGFCASFSVSGGYATGALADYFVDGTTAWPIVISQGDSETTNYFVYAINGVARQIEAHGGRWVREDSGATPVSASTDIIYNQGGSFKLDGGSYFDISSAHPSQITINHRQANPNMVSQLEIDNAVFDTIYQTKASFLTGDAPGPMSPDFHYASFATERGRVVTRGFFAPFSVASGTVTAAKGSPYIVGVGTQFLRGTGAGNGYNQSATILIQGQPYPILQIADDTHLTLGFGSAINYVGPGGSGLAYVLGFGGASTDTPAIHTGSGYVDGNWSVNTLTIRSPSPGVAPRVDVGTVGDASHVAQVTFNAAGQATSATSVSINGGASGTVTFSLSCSFRPTSSTSPAFCTNAGCTTTATINYVSGGSVGCTITPSSMSFSGGFKQ